MCGNQPNAIEGQCTDFIKNTFCTGCPGDLNGDGVVDGADLASLLANWGPCSS
jgi:hypothetical protein